MNLSFIPLFLLILSLIGCSTNNSQDNKIVDLKVKSWSDPEKVLGKVDCNKRQLLFNDYAYMSKIKNLHEIRHFPPNSWISEVEMISYTDGEKMNEYYENCN